MKLAKAKEYYGLGLVVAFTTVPCEGGWLLTIETTTRDGDYGHVMETALGEQKVYSTLDSLDRDLVRIVGSRQSWSLRL